MRKRTRRDRDRERKNRPAKSVDLPISLRKQTILDAVAANRVTVLVSETGSGKTTQVPQFLCEAGYGPGAIAITQPRRVAALTASARVAKEVGCRLGGKVGYSIRFDSCLSPATRVVYMTDGMLLREALSDNKLKKYSVIILDEAHERTVSTDVLFALVKSIVVEQAAATVDSSVGRDDLRVIVMSATLEADKYASYFDGAAVVYIAGRQHPVSVWYTPTPEADYLDALIITVLQIHVGQPMDGDILAFMPGQEEIEAAIRLLEQRCQRFAAVRPTSPHATDYCGAKRCQTAVGPGLC
jgi:HrpA-like RNA helicase